MMLKYTRNLLAGVCASMLLAGTAFAGDLKVAYDGSDPANIAAINDLIADFEKEYPDIKVELTQYEREAYKTSIRNFLSSNSQPDVASWYPGNRMKPFVEAGQFEDITDLWEENNLEESLSSTAGVMTIDGKKWGVPYTFYQWGLYYRKDLFEKYDIEPPTNWEEFLAAGETLKENGITPITVGSKALWPLAGIFTQLNMRINGYEVHRDLTAGKIPYTDPRIQKVFDYWGELVEKDFIIENHSTYSWQEALAPMVQDKAAMYVIGNFAVEQFVVAGLKKEQLGFISFPEITPGIARSEEAPVDSFHIPTGAKNKKDARTFLTYLVRADVQTKASKTLGQLPVNKDSSVDPSDPFLVGGFEALSTAANLGQFYDRDADPEMANEGMKGFQEFLLNPDRREKILKRLDKVQARINKKK